MEKHWTFFWIENPPDENEISNIIDVFFLSFHLFCWLYNFLFGGKCHKSQNREHFPPLFAQNRSCEIWLLKNLPYYKKSCNLPTTLLSYCLQIHNKPTNHHPWISTNMVNINNNTTICILGMTQVQRLILPECMWIGL